MLKNITLSADDELIRRARDKAEGQGSTLNNEFRRWLAMFAEQEERARDYHDIMQKLAYARPGGRFSRDELNAR